jgi:hypothetical protein
MDVVVAVWMMASICNATPRRNNEVGDIHAKARLGFMLSRKSPDRFSTQSMLLTLISTLRND